jgi:outer membrane usher protein
MRQALALILLSAQLLVLPAQESADLLPVPLHYEGSYLGDVEIAISGDSDVLVPSDTVLELLRDYLSERVLADWSDLVREGQRVAPEAFDPLGIHIRFDWDDLALIATIPPLSRRPVLLAVSGTRTVPAGIGVEPADVSLIANLDLWSRFTYESLLLEAAFSPEVAASIYGLVLEVQGGVRTGEVPLFLDYARASWDFPAIGYRIQAGDLVWFDTDLVGVSQLTGVSFFREGSLDTPDARIDRVLDRFFLPEDASVAVYVNESRVQRRRLAAGNYDLAAVPLGDGTNTILVVWEDAPAIADESEGMDEPTDDGADPSAGETDPGVRLVELVIPYDSELQEPGRLDAGVSLAIANREVVRPVVVAYQRYGLTPQITIGARQGVELFDLQADAALSFVLATRAGNFLFDPSVGLGPTDRLVLDFPLRYSFLDSRPSSYLSFGLSTGYQFARSHDAATTNQTLNASGYVNLALPEGFSVTPRASWTYGLTDASHQVNVRAALRKSLRGGSSVSADIGFRWDEELSFLARVTYAASFPDAQQNLFLQQDLDSQEFSAYWSRYPGQSERDITYNLSTKIPVNMNEVVTASGQLGYVHPYFRGSISHGLTAVVAQGESRNATSIALQSALLLVEDTFAVSIPVRDSFVVVAPGESFADVPLVISRSGTSVERDASGAPVVFPDLSAYSAAQIRVEPEEILLGLQEPDLTFVVTPTFRSGTVIRAEPQRTIYAGGVLLDEAEEPRAYELGRWERADSVQGGVATDGSVASGEFFTDEAGYFEIYGIGPGEYTLLLPSDPNIAYSAIVPEDANEYVDLGELLPGDAPTPDGGGEQ